MSTKACIILTTTDDKIIADVITSQLLSFDLAACVQIEDVNSFFKWNNKLRSAKEFRIMIKAKSSNYKQIQQLILGVHNYETPQIIKIDISDCLPAYLDWINNTSK